MSCPNTEKAVLLHYGELPFSQKEEIESHIKACPQCAAAIETISGLDSMRLVPSASLERITLEKAFAAGHKFSLREKVLAAGLCFALALLFVIPKNQPAPSFYQDSDFTAVESEISAIKYDMADFSDSALDYAISCVDAGEKIDKEAV